MRTIAGVAVLVVLVALFIAEAVRESRTYEWQAFLWREQHQARVAAYRAHWIATLARLTDAFRSATVSMEEFGHAAANVGRIFAANSEDARHFADRFRALARNAHCPEREPGAVAAAADPEHGQPDAP